MKIYESSRPLQSKTRVGKAKYWQGYVVSNGDQWFTQTSYWQDKADGTQSLVQWSEPYEAFPKNVGKANETSAKQQATAEYTSMVKKQMDKGYAHRGVISDILPLPMLAHPFAKRGSNMQWPTMVQPKYNGQRMFFDGTKGWSRGGKEIIPAVINHLVAQFPVQLRGKILDGELILPGNLLLQETLKSTKKYVPDLSERLNFIVYDVVDVQLTYSDRHTLLESNISQIATLASEGSIVRAPTYAASDIGEVMTYHKQFTSDGYEGTMIRDNSAGYDIGNRSVQLQKFKDFVDAEFKIVAVKSGEGRFKGAAIFVCENELGETFDCMPEGSMEHRRDLYNTRTDHINKFLKIRYQELSRDKTPLFPVGIEVRDLGDF
jgi:DNA ligase-1